MSFFLFWLVSFVLGVVLFDLKALHHLKKCLNFHGLYEQGKIGLLSPKNCSKIGLSDEALQTVCLKYSISTNCLLSANRNSSAELLKSGVTVVLISE